MSSVVRTQKGSLPISGRTVPRRQDEEIKPGAIYNLHGSINPYVMMAAPDSWIEQWLGRARTLTDPSGTNRFQVLGATLAPNGNFVIQVRANHGSPIVLIVGGVILGLAVLAGMTIEQVFEVIPEAGAGVKEGIAGLTILAGVVFAGALLWKRQ